MAFYVYLMAGRKNGTLYVGMTDDLIRRIWERREGVAAGFTKQYGVKLLIWFEEHPSSASAETSAGFPVAGSSRPRE